MKLRSGLNDGNCDLDTIERIRQFAKQIGGKNMTYEECTR